MTEEGYLVRWKKIYSEMKIGEAVAPVFATNSTQENAEAIRNILAQMAIDIAALQKSNNSG